MPTPGSASAGTRPKRGKVQIFILQVLDEHGQPIPRQEKYVVATLDVPPTILYMADSYDEAASWAVNNRYSLEGAPQP